MTVDTFRLSGVNVSCIPFSGVERSFSSMNRLYKIETAPYTVPFRQLALNSSGRAGSAAQRQVEGNGV